MLLAAVFALALGAAGHVADTKLARPICEDRLTPARSPGVPVARKLADMPNADKVLTVLRRDERGCTAPVRVRRDIGVQRPR